VIKTGSGEWWGNLVTFILLSVTLGWLGTDRFFKGEAGWGVLKLITLGGLGVWWIVDVCVFAYRLGTSGQWTVAQARSQSVQR
jgi:hypothetical protein